MALFMYFLLGAVIVYYELTRKRYFKIDLITFFNIFFFLVYSFAPAALILEGTHLILDDMPYGHEYFGNYFFTPYLVFFSYLFFIAGFQTLSFANKESISKYNFEFKFWWNENTIFMLLPFAYLLLLFFLFIYINEIGGLSKAIETAEAYRAGVLEYNKFGFVMQFFPLNTILLYYVFYKYFLQRDKNKVYLFYFFVSLVIVILVTILHNSRGYLIFQVIGLYVIAANYYKNYFFKYLIPSLIVAFIIIKYGKPFFNAVQFYFTDGYDAFVSAFTGWLEAKEQEGNSLVPYFTHPIVSLEASLQRSTTDVELRYFRDIVDAFVLLLPNELLNIKEPEMLLMQQNTLLLQGRDTEIVLPGILGYFSYAGHVIGLFLGSYLYGLIGAMFMQLFIPIYKNYKASIVYIYLFFLSYGYFVFRGVPSQVINDSFIYTVVMVFLLYNSKLKITRN